MAITANTLMPMAPWGGQGGTLGGAVLEFPATDGSIVAGDVLIFASGKVDEDNTAPLSTLSVICGVALSPSAAADDPVSVAPAFANKLFEANIISATDTDETGVFADNVGVKHGIIESAANDAGKACIDISNTTAAQISAHTLFYARQRSPSAANADSRALSGVGVTNPRVVFCFSASMFYGDKIV